MLNKKLLGSVSSLPQDDNFENVTLLLNGDGTNGAQNNTFVDSSTNNFTITRNGNTTQGSFSPYGSNWSNFLNGSSYLSLSSNTALNLGSGDFTIEAFINFSSLSSNRGIVYSGTDPNSNFGYGLQWSSNALYFWYTTNGSNLASQSVSWTPSVGVWYHLAVTRNGNDLKFFVNGTQTGSTQSLSGVTIYSSTSDMRVGGESTGSPTSLPGSMNGYMSNFRLVKGTSLYNSSFTPSTVPLTAVSGTSLLTCQSNRFIDNSSNNFALTITGSPSVQRFSPFEPTAPYSTSVIGGSGYFDGSGDYLSLTGATAIGSSNYTLEYWVYPTSTELLQGVFVTTVNAATGVLRTGIYNGKVYVDIYDGTGSIDSGSAVPLNAWSHIAITKSGSSYTSYLNGAVNTTWTDSTTLTGTAWVTGRLQSDGYDFKGYVSNLRLVVGSVVYTAAFTPPSAPITAITDTKLLQSMTNAGIPDLAMQNNLETVGNAQVSTSVKKYGTGSLAFDGTGDYLLSAANQVIATSRFTVEAWLYKSSADEKYAIAQGTSGNAGRFAIGVASSNWFVQIGSSNVNAGSVSTNTWTHIAVTYDGTTLTLYVNGTSVGTASTTQAVQNTRLRIGTLGPDWSSIYEWDGYMDDIRITNGVIRYTTTFTPPASALPTF